MRLLCSVVLVPLAAVFACSAQDGLRKSYQEPAAEFLFDRQPLTFECADRLPGRREGNPGEGRLQAGNEPPYALTRSEELHLSKSEVPALTITSDPHGWIAVGGNERGDWSIRFCSRGEGNSQAEAYQQLQDISMTHLGSMVSINNLSRSINPYTTGSLLLAAPADAPTIIHASSAPVVVRDMSGPLRVTASHARATILDTTGQVDADAFVVDFAGSQGKVTLTAEAEINLKMTATKFDGTILAWAQRPVRMLVPVGFLTPFQAMVNRPHDFVCRADLCSKVKAEKTNGLYVFTYAGDGSANPERVHLRSEQATVVIDNIGRKN
jgi:hypothetical protein